VFCLGFAGSAALIWTEILLHKALIAWVYPLDKWLTNDNHGISRLLGGSCSRFLLISLGFTTQLDEALPLV
jgi:hypothetical protein